MWVDQYAFDGPVGEDVSFDPEFKNKTMLEQLGKIVDGETARSVVKPEKFNPFNSVITDDGFKIKVNAKQAETIRELVMNVDVRDRLDVIKQIQMKDGLTKILEYIKIKGL